MFIQFNEQDLVDSVCVYVAMEERCDPYDVDVDLSFESSRFSANVSYSRGQRELNEQDLIDAIAVFLRDYHNFNPNDLKIDLAFQENEGIGATIDVI